MEHCPTCGSSYGVTHLCPGPLHRALEIDAKWRPPTGFAPLHYLRQSLAIARLDDGAVMSASRDRRALLYGAAIWLAIRIGVIGWSMWWNWIGPLSWIALLCRLGLLTALEMFLKLGQYAICHLLARWWFGGRGTYIGVLGPLVLGTLLFPTFPIVGSINTSLYGFFVVESLDVIGSIWIVIGGLWSVAVAMIVFEDVDGIARLKAFGLSAGAGIVFFQLWACAGILI